LKFLYNYEYIVRRSKFPHLPIFTREWYVRSCMFLGTQTMFSHNYTSGFSHSAFTFAYESLVIKSSVAQTEIPPGALITFLQKGLEYVAIEEHINEVILFLLYLFCTLYSHWTGFYQDGSIQEFDNNYSLLSPLISEAVAVKEDRRVRRHVSNPSGATASALGGSGGAAGGGQTETVPMDEEGGDANGEAAGGDSSALALKPSVIQLM
jgi:hypothetical protein